MRAGPPAPVHISASAFSEAAAQAQCTSGTRRHSQVCNQREHDMLLLTAILAAFTRGSGGHSYDTGTLESSAGTGTGAQGRLPYMASIRRHGDRQHVCSAILLDQQHVLTAAHCVDPQSHYSAGLRPIVYIGLTNVDADGEEFVEVLRVSHTIIHENWTPTVGQRSRWNLAILRTEQRSQKQAPTILSDHFELSSGQKLASIGYGAGEDGPALGQDIFGTVKIEDMQFLEGALCNRPDLWNGGLEEHMLCGLNQGATASCIGRAVHSVKQQNDGHSQHPALCESIEMTRCTWEICLSDVVDVSVPNHLLLRHSIKSHL
ncbi:unnamed protein product [Ostreobium quekettii]|uniref:Peptidase S1 domain-containing protein n=1 Tax=Ostreobium quekettii TaxID=121088 RepID=A0A8S1J7F3_9CHLO|nr:unnamed protein product [Ostreobium quekettii]